MEYRLSSGRILIIDKRSLPILRLGSWYVGANGYVYTNRALLHRILTNAGPEDVVDHRNGDPLDNRLRNLRLVTNTENIRCRHVRNKNNTSGFPGVSKTFARGRSGVTYDLAKPWFAKITVARAQIALGRFETKEQAATAYEVATQYYFGKFAPHTLPVFKRCTRTSRRVRKQLREAA